jgi:hypothetical protein
MVRKSTQDRKSSQVVTINKRRSDNTLGMGPNENRTELGTQDCRAADVGSQTQNTKESA